MTRFLICTMPITGHVYPGLPIARALVRRGHEVWWYTGRRFQSAVEATGARYVPMEAAYDFDDREMDAAFPGYSQQTGLARLTWGFKRIFVDPLPGQVADLQWILRMFPAEVLLADTAFLGAGAIHELGGPPWATYGITVLTIGSRDTAPFGTALPPDSSALGRLRNRTLGTLFTHGVFRGVTQHASRVRATLGLSSLPHGILDTLSPYLYLHASTPAFEYPRSDLPPQVHFIGPLLPDPPASFTPPDWWHELRAGRPVVHVTQGTIATALDDLIAPTLRALADEDVLVVATTGGKTLEYLTLESPTPVAYVMPYAGMIPESRFGGVPLALAHYADTRASTSVAEGLPPNARVEPFLPYADLMPHVSVMITNGGYGGVQFALAHGVPLVVAGATQEKPEIAARVAWSGAGINLKTQNPTPAQIRDAVRTMLLNHNYRHQAERIRADYRRHDAPAEAAVLLERLAATRRPVRRVAARPDYWPHSAEAAAARGGE